MRRVIWMVPVLLWCVALSVTMTAAARRGAVDRAPQGGWTLPANAPTVKSPLTVNDAVLAAGKRLYTSKCQRCHGTMGKGDGPDADLDHQDDMDLTVKGRAARNPDGVIFYKAWNGRSSPKMPALKDDNMTEPQVWAIVAFVQTLRAK